MIVSVPSRGVRYLNLNSDSILVAHNLSFRLLSGIKVSEQQ